MLKWGSKMRPPFFDGFGMKSRTTGHPTGESKASQILKIPMFRALLKTRPFLPCGRRRISVPCPDDPCRAKYFRAVPCLAVPGSWYQDLGTKIYGEPERRSLSVCRGARGAAGPPPGGLGGWKPPRKSGGSGGRQPPSKNNFMGQR